MLMTVLATTAGVLAGILLAGLWWRRGRWDERRAVVWLLDRDGTAIPTRLHGTDPVEARVLVESLGKGAAVGLGLRFDDGRVVRHHFGQELVLDHCDQLSIPLPRAFLPPEAA